MNDKIICPHCKKEIPISTSVGGDAFKAFEFLNNPVEDIYNEGDGTTIKE